MSNNKVDATFHASPRAEIEEKVWKARLKALEVQCAQARKTLEIVEAELRIHRRAEPPSW